MIGCLKDCSLKDGENNEDFDKSSFRKAWIQY